MSNPIPTPMTNAMMAKTAFGQPCNVVNAEFARQLERDLTEAKQKIEDISASSIHSCHEKCQRTACILRRERDAWKETATQHARDVDFYRGLIVKTGELFGPAAKTADDGTVMESVLALKVPELVALLHAKHELFKATGDEIPLEDAAKERARARFWERYSEKLDQTIFALPKNPVNRDVLKDLHDAALYIQGYAPLVLEEAIGKARAELDRTAPVNAPA